MKITLVIPNYNDWDSLKILIHKIESHLANTLLFVELIIVDDCSTQSLSINKLNFPITVLELNQNLGHQRAIAIGLAYCYAKKDSDAVIIMDGDGEDNPAYLLQLFKEVKYQNKIVFASRVKRNEGIIFKVFYGFYKLIHLLCTGKKISFGNFSIIPGKFLKRILFIPELWNHYSAAILKSKIPFTILKTDRAKRYMGKSKMNFTSLVMHGFASLSVFLEEILTRIIILTFFVFIIDIILFVIILYSKYVSDMASPGWATTTILGMATVTLILLVFSFLTGLIVLNSRKQREAYMLMDVYETYIHKKIEL